jgi:hypothetical protein
MGKRLISLIIGIGGLLGCIFFGSMFAAGVFLRQYSIPRKLFFVAFAAGAVYMAIHALDFIHSGLKNRNGAIDSESYEQVKNTSPFQYFAQIVVGAVFCIAGLMVAYAQYESRKLEVVRYGSSESHVRGLLVAGVLVVIGVFMAHAGTTHGVPSSAPSV